MFSPLRLIAAPEPARPVRAVAGIPQQKLDGALEQLADAELIFGEECRRTQSTRSSTLRCSTCVQHAAVRPSPSIACWHCYDLGRQIPASREPARHIARSADPPFDDARRTLIADHSGAQRHRPPKAFSYVIPPAAPVHRAD